ncbi:MAG: PEP-CTERM sorting domain-containing protein [Colwellia sp.]|nr:PEP-CTERM sorting domain-containing protein [Colwellia sp.]
MKKLILVIGFMFLSSITIIGLYCSKAEALYIQVENIGPAPLLALNLNFATTPPNFSGYDVQLFSHRARTDPTNVYFPFIFNETSPLSPGSSFDTYSIPELTNTNIPSFRLHSSGMSTFNAFSGYYYGVLITPDITSIVLASSSPAIPVSARVTFKSGGVPSPIPEPSTFLLLGTGLLVITGITIRKRFKRVKEG